MAHHYVSGSLLVRILGSEHAMALVYFLSVSLLVVCLLQLHNYFSRSLESLQINSQSRELVSTVLYTTRLMRRTLF